MKRSKRLIQRRPGKIKLLKAYREQVRSWLLGKQCAVFKGKRATQCHHIRGRLGPLLMDKRFWLAVSGPGHDWIHRNINEARECGFIALPGEWNTIPKDEESERLRNKITQLTRPSHDTSAI